MRTVLVELAEEENAWNAILCCTASHRVQGAEGSEEGYIQGAGDDSEGWSCGLTPEVFWENRETLMEANEGDAEELIRRVMGNRIAELDEAAGRGLRDEKDIAVGGRGLVCVGMLDAIGKGHSDGKIVIALTQDGRGGTLDNCLHLRLSNGKAGSRALREQLHLLRGLLPITMGLRPSPLAKILCVCPTGKDLSVGVALMILCLYFDEDGRFSRLPSSRAIQTG